MASLDDIVSQLSAALDTTLSIASAARMGTDYRDDRQKLAAGATLYQIRSQYEQAAFTSNDVIERGSISLVFYHGLADSDDERAYTESAMHTEQATLLDKSFWLTNMGSIRGISDDGGPELDPNVEREGNIISWGIIIVFDIVPDP